MFRFPAASRLRGVTAPQRRDIATHLRGVVFCLRDVASRLRGAFVHLCVLRVASYVSCQIVVVCFMFVITTPIRTIGVWFVVAGNSHLLKGDVVSPIVVVATLQPLSEPGRRLL